jgi:predicted AAA+ superfamily ATPase
MKRFFAKQLDSWFKRPNRRPLIVRGARQVGKSYAIREWAKENFGQDGLLEINLEESPKLRSVFDKDLHAETVLNELNLLTGFNLRKPNSILFIDEIQYSPNAIVSLRYLYEQVPDLPVIAAGSLLEFALDTHGTPVGRIEYLYLFPLSFEEFLLASGKDQLANYISSFDFTNSISPLVHEELLHLLRLYIRIGGMPRAIMSYLQTKDIKEVSREHELLLSTYKEDFPKYARKSQIETLGNILTTIPHHIAQQKVKYSKIDPELRIEKIKRAIDLLEKAHLINRAYCSLAQKLPLASLRKTKSFKLFFLDVGLLQHALGFDWTKLDPDSDISLTKNGIFAEQFVAQELLAKRSSNKKYELFYWDRPIHGSDAEVDFLIEYQNNVIPLEIKSGLQGSLKSLHSYIREVNPDHAFIASQRNIEQMEGITWIPLYLVGSL